MTDRDAMIEAVARAFASRYWEENPSYDTLPKAAQASLERAIAHALEALEPFIQAREQAAREEEKRAVVEWLFKDAEALEEADPGRFNQFQAEAVRECADAITRNEHRSSDDG